MRTLLLLAASLVSLLAACGTPVVGQCTASQPQQITSSDGGTMTCQCKGPCGCFYEDGGRCPQ